MSELADWLKRHGLENLAGSMEENDIDIDLLPDLTEQDLKDLGLSIGQRRRLQKALAKENDERPPPPGDGNEVAATDPTGASTGPRDVAERRYLTVLFCDLVGSTELSRRLDPEEIRDLMRAYQDAVAGVITRYGGYVAKYLGDGVLAYFGWPVAFEDQAERAVRAGLGLGGAVSTITASDGTILAVRAGIASGEVVVGDLVSATGTETGAVSGDTPNLAARMQAAAEPGEVLITEETRRLLGSAFEVESRDGLKLKGFDDAHVGYLVSQERLVESRFEALRGSSLSSLVGRMQEVALLRERWAEARSGQGAVVLLSGEAGIGKSRLVEALVQEADGNDGQVVRLQCSPYFVDSAFHPLVERIRQRADLVPGEPLASQLDKLRAVLPQEDSDLDAALGVYARLLSIDIESDDGPTTEERGPAQIKELTLKVLVEGLVQRACQKPLLLVVEDAHWVDPSSLEFLERLVPIIAELPMQMVVTHRPEWSSDWGDLFGHVTPLTLGRLNRDQIAELIEGLFGDRPPERLIDDISQKTDGVPLFIEEFCQAISDQGGRETAEEITVPTSLQSSLMARLDRLPPAAKSLALVASVIGREFDAGLLEEVAGISASALSDGLAALRQMQVIFASGNSSGTFVFRHALIQDTAYQSLLSKRRREYHAAVARALEHHHPDILGREPELVARHYHLAGEETAALPLWTRAAKRALSRSAAFEAVSHARQVFRIAKESGQGEAEARFVLGKSLESAGQIETALQTLREAMDLARRNQDHGLFAEIVIAFANSLFLSLEPPEEAVEPLEEALSRLTENDSVVKSQVLSHLVRGCVLSGDRPRARQYRIRAIKAAEACDDKTSLHTIQVASFIAPVVLREREDIEDWRLKVDEMLRTADQINDDAKGRTRSIAIYVAAEMGDRDRMEDALSSLNEVGGARQHMHIAWVERHCDALNAILDGRFLDAERLSGEALEIGRRTHGAHVEGVYGIQMFTIRREQDRLQEVAPVVKQLIDDDPDARTWKPGFALIASDLGFTAPAQRILDEMALDDFDLELDAKYSTTLSYLAEVASALGDEKRCERLYELLLPYRELTITAGVTTVCLGAAARYLGLLATALGQWDEAEEHLRAALDLNGRMRARPWTAHSHHDLAELLAHRGAPSDEAEVVQLRQKTLDMASQFDMVALQKKCRRHLH